MKQIVTITGTDLKVVTSNVEVNAVGAGKKTKAQMRLEALKAAGVDVSKYFPLGDDQLVKIENGAAVPVDMDDATIDAVGKKIVEGGYVSNWKLFRRWVMSQMFHMLRQMETDKLTFNEVLQRKGYEYQWRMLENELYAQVKMSEHGDLDNVGARNRWFNGDVASDMATDYISKLRKYVDDNLIYNVKKDKDGNEKKAYKHTCKGNPYVRLQNKDIFVSDLEKKSTHLSERLLTRWRLSLHTSSSMMQFTSSTRTASISNGIPSRLMLSSMPTKVLALITPCATSSCSTEQDS